VSHWECMTRIGSWEGYRVTTVERFDGTRPRVWIALEPIPNRPLQCGRCGARVGSVHDATQRWVRDLPLFDAETWLQVRRCRVWCPQCAGPTLAAIPWLAPYARLTQRMGESVARLCQVLPLKHVAEYYGLGWDQVKAIDKAFLARTLGPVDLTGVEAIAMDEFAIQKGHRYATVVVESHSRRVLWVGRGRGREDVRPFFRILGRAGCEQLRAVAMDMNAAYELEVQHHCPQAEIVYDLFHVVAKYGREVIDRVRVDEANRLRHDRRARAVIKGARWLLLRNRENLAGPEDRVRLQELLSANRKLLTVYVLKDDLKHLWTYHYPGAARRFWHAWYTRAVRSRITPLVAFAKRLKPYLHGILAHCKWPLHTSLIEGINNKIKVIKRMAYGFRDDEYFFLKIRAAFPGNTG